MIVREVFDSGLCLVTETMPHVRSVSVGAWLTRGSRHESQESGGIAHFVEHMLFKGTAKRSAEDIAQSIDSVGGHMDAFTSKEYAGYYFKVLDEHLPLAVDIVSDIVINPLFPDDEVEREKRVILEEIKMVEDTPDDLVHELFVQSFWEGHPLGKPILGVKESVEEVTRESLKDYFAGTYTAPNLVIAAAGNLEHESLRDLVGDLFSGVPVGGEPREDLLPTVAPRIVTKTKNLEQAHICLGTVGYSQDHPDRYVGYVLNTVLGGSMSSRLFQNVREKRGLAYAIFSGISAYRDAGSLTVYVGCGSETVGEVLDLVVTELRGMKQPVPEAELRRAKDHLKGSLMLSLENTSSRMSNLARQEIYFDHQFSMDDALESIEAVTIDDVQRVAKDLFGQGALAVTVLGPQSDLDVSKQRLDLG